MAAVSNIPLTLQTKWSDVSVPLKELATKASTPTLVKVTKGQYRNIGVAKTVNSELIVHSIRKTRKILAETLKIKDSKRAPVSEQKLSLPVTYQGWFELLSEDGKAVKPIGTVGDLAKVFPQSCLVRENMKGFLPKDNGELTLEKSRVVFAGEHLTLVGDLTIPVLGSKGITKKRLLRCFDQKGDSVYFTFEQKGLFSPVAGQGNISGVHNVKGLIEKFRLPIIVRLVHGIIPSRLDKNQFTGVFRLIAPYSDETVFACPLKKDAKMVPISTREPLKLAVAANNNDVKDTDEFRYHLNRCSNMMVSYMNSIHVLVNIPSEALIKSREEPILQDQSPERPKNSKVEEDLLFDEIDDIYQYVREGGPPPKPRPRLSMDHTGNTTTVVPTVTSQLSDTTAVGDQPQQKQDYDYWEEPIYEQIETVQRRKQAIGQDVVQTGTTVTTGPYKEAIEKKQTFRHLTSDSPTSRPLSFVKTEPMVPLPIAQDIGFQCTSSTTDGRLAADEITEEQPPPIPPKKNEYQSPFQMEVTSSSLEHLAYPQPVPTTHGFSFHTTEAHASESPSSITGTTTASYSSHARQLPGTAVIQYPRYVAVARVGGSDDFPSSDGSDNSSEHKQSRRSSNTSLSQDVDNTKKNLQTLYL